MIKKILALTLSALILSAVSSCGNKESDTSTDKPANGNVTNLPQDTQIQTVTEALKKREPQNDDYVIKDGLVYQLKVGTKDGVPVTEAYLLRAEGEYFEKTVTGGKDEEGFDIKCVEKLTVPAKIENPGYLVDVNQTKASDEYIEGVIPVVDLVENYRAVSAVHFPVKTVEIAASFKEIHVQFNAENIILPDGLETLGAVNFNGAFFNLIGIYGSDISGHKINITIPASVKEILPLDKELNEENQAKNLVKIICPAGSYAEQFAKDNGIEYENN